MTVRLSRREAAALLVGVTGGCGASNGRPPTAEGGMPERLDDVTFFRTEGAVDEVEIDTYPAVVFVTGPEHPERGIHWIGEPRDE